MGCWRQHRGGGQGVLHPEGEHLPLSGADCAEAGPHGGGAEGGGTAPHAGADSQAGSGCEDERGGACSGKKREVRPGEEGGLGGRMLAWGGGWAWGRMLAWGGGWAWGEDVGLGRRVGCS